MGAFAERTIRDTTAVIVVTGRLTGRDTDLIRQQIDTLVTDWSEPLVLDFSYLDFIDSSGIGLLVELNQRCAAGGSSLSITDTNPDPQPVPELQACILPDGIVGVFPGDDRTCTQLGLPGSAA